MGGIRGATLVLAAAALPAAAAAHGCVERIVEIEALLDAAAEEAIVASSAGQAVAGARQAQVAEGAADEPAVPVQEEPEEEAALEEAEEAGEGGQRFIEARAALREARATAEGGDEAACLEAVDALILAALTD